MLQNHSVSNWSNISRNAANIEENLLNSCILQIIFAVIYLVIFVLGLCGNLFVCYVVVSRPIMHTITNFFIMNLALADILLCLICVPFTPIYTFLGQWIFGQLICHLVPYIQSVIIYLSTFTLTCIAVDRYVVILYPLRPRMKIATCFKILAVIWIVSILISVPYGVYIEMKLYNNEIYVCEENWPSDRIIVLFGMMNFIFHFIIPFSIIAFCYITIRNRIKLHEKRNRNQKKRKRTNWMLIVMVVIFAVCWLPLNIINILYDFKWGFNNYHFRLIFLLTHCLAMSATCYNPFLYTWLSENFRKEFENVWPKSMLIFMCCLSRKRRQKLCQSTQTEPSTLQNTIRLTTLQNQVTRGSLLST